ncbi:acyl-CoA dehydrogenase family protein [Sphingobium sp. D43FB]|uniref:acyl-CoA dehydrogenase family protein n=1 Tax=Sphingobium sp. D43FB TaxID=2017595 RepID=UPI000BB58966|nr:acyl-CoA dehydrogenase family protein [Sphingobium sp. D43FB]PBN41713.1 acyl-CoA dehydrogenase [Sphingobium sp. D43FB]
MGCSAYPSLEALVDQTAAALDAARSFAADVRSRLLGNVGEGAAVNPALLDHHQHDAHGYAWIETTIAALKALMGWAVAAQERGDFGEIDALILRLAFADYLSQLAGGLAIGPNEYFRPGRMGLEASARRMVDDPAVCALIACADARSRASLIALVRAGASVNEASGDAALDEIRAQFRRFTAERITPFAHRWHLDNALIPDALIAELGALGTFGICVDPEYGGLGLGKLEMCVVTEELSRGWIGAGSLGTRSEIAAELIGLGGSKAQKARWMSGLASGEILPTAVFTEPGAGSDLASLTTRAVAAPDGSWRISGAKTWITHAARTDLMTMLARTGGEGHRGLSMFLLAKPRGSETDPFPGPGLAGSEIAVLGYRGMREYELSFDGFEASAESLLGNVEGEGFRQLMRTFEGARIQTAARAVGVAWRAYELGIDYALARNQFGRPLVDFPRVADKLVAMLFETVAARELAYAAARTKDAGGRSDVEAGMAKLLAARVAWTNADASLQIHGGNGYALETEISRILCDARILSVFEGAAEIQAHIIARGLLERGTAER